LYSCPVSKGWFAVCPGLVGTLWITYDVGAHFWAALTATAFADVENLAIALLATWRQVQARQDLVASEVLATKVSDVSCAT
jgi:hypothetical protein